MSLSVEPPAKPPPLVLRTAEQYDMWKARVADACWAATGKDIFAVDDDDCDTAISCAEVADSKTRKEYEWLNKCWHIVTTSLTNYLD